MQTLPWLVPSTACSLQPGRPERQSPWKNERQRNQRISYERSSCVPRKNQCLNNIHGAEGRRQRIQRPTRLAPAGEWLGSRTTPRGELITCCRASLFVHLQFRTCAHGIDRDPLRGRDHASHEWSRRLQTFDPVGVNTILNTGLSRTYQWAINSARSGAELAVVTAGVDSFRLGDQSGTTPFVKTSAVPSTNLVKLSTSRLLARNTLWLARGLEIDVKGTRTRGDHRQCAPPVASRSPQRFEDHYS